MRCDFVCILAFSVPLLAQTTTDQIPVFDHDRAVCCSGRFTIDNVIKAVRIPPPKAGQVQFIEITDRKYVAPQYAGAMGDPLFVYRRRALAEFPQLPALAYIFQSSLGASAVLWNPSTGFYDIRRIWGKDLIRLQDGSEVVALTMGDDFNVGPPWERPWIVRAWVWAKRPIDQDAALRTLKEMRSLLATDSVQIVLAPHPYLWQEAHFPLVVPAFGALGELGLAEVKERAYISCAAPRGSSTIRCIRLGREESRQ